MARTNLPNAEALTKPGQGQWLQISAQTQRWQVLEAAFEAVGARAITISESGFPDAGATPPRHRVVVALFAAGADTSAITRRLDTMLAPQTLSWRLAPIADRDWVRAWMADQKPQRFGRRLWICPHHEQVDAEGALVVRLDPGRAFGSGGHASTALCLEWLDAHPPEDLTVLDYGTGSGILALAALRLGAAAAQAVDCDPQALQVAGDNARTNDLQARLRLDPPQAAQTADVVLANILAGPLVELAARLTDLVRPGGRLILSGLLADQGPSVQQAYEPAFEFHAGAACDGWVRLDGMRR